MANVSGWILVYLALKKAIENQKICWVTLMQIVFNKRQLQLISFENETLFTDLKLFFR